MKHYLNIIIVITVVILFSSCTSKKNDLKSGDWLFKLSLSETNPDLTLPFNVKVINKDTMYILNAEEKILVTNISYKDDSVFITMPVFDSEFKAKFNKNKISGYWYKYTYDKEYKIPFTADYGITKRFDVKTTSEKTIEGKWLSIFTNNKGSQTNTVGVFKQKDNIVTGTFLTEVGDYRFLEGVIDHNRIKLSCFDGAHAFLFEGDIKDDGSIEGFFRSGSHWEEKWTAKRDKNATLSDMKKLTYLKPGYDKIQFQFPNNNSEIVSLDDSQFQNKVTILQIFGTWCPNCMDETRYLVQLHKKYHKDGLEIIGLDFEPKPNMEYFKKRSEKFIKDLNVPYPVLLAGHANKEKAAESLPMLNKIISFPTMIILDKKGKIKEIHTGFNGPGTGELHKKYTQETEKLIQKLLKE